MSKKSGFLGTLVKWVAVGVAVITVSGFFMNLARDDEEEKTPNTGNDTTIETPTEEESLKEKLSVNLDNVIFYTGTLGYEVNSADHGVVLLDLYEFAYIPRTVIITVIGYGENSLNSERKYFNVTIKAEVTEDETVVIKDVNDTFGNCDYETVEYGACSAVYDKALFFEIGYMSFNVNGFYYISNAE